MKVSLGYSLDEVVVTEIAGFHTIKIRIFWYCP